MTLTGPFIDDVAPPASKARWFAWLSLTPTLGVAIGYKLGDLTQYLSWRILFYIEAGVAVPVVLFCLLAPAVRLRGKLTQVNPEGRLTFRLNRSIAWKTINSSNLFRLCGAAMRLAQHLQRVSGPLRSFSRHAHRTSIFQPT